MTIHVCILGIDGSGKSTMTAALPAVLAAEFGIRVGSAGETYRLSDPDQDHLAPGFEPEGLPIRAKLSASFKRWAKRNVNNRRLYPGLKMAQMLCQDSAAWKIARKCHADVFVSDGNTLLSSVGRAANYIRPASDAHERRNQNPEPEDLLAVFRYLLDGVPIPAESREKLPDLRKGRKIERILNALGLHAVWLPDLMIFLDLSPHLAFERILSRGARVDRHENEDDLHQTRKMYLRTLEAFKGYRGEEAVARIEIDARSPGRVLEEVVKTLQPFIQAKGDACSGSGIPLGTTRMKLSGASVLAKSLNPRYLFLYLLRHLHHDAWREILFPASRSGRLFLKEGYSAGVMRAIYDRSPDEAGILERVFLNYPLHRAVSDRLENLQQGIESELRKRLAEARDIRLFTAPSGFAYDLFGPLETILGENPSLAKRIHLLAADLDPRESLGDELTTRAGRAGIGFTFVRGDLTDGEVRKRLGEMAPYDLALFVGLSSWLPKPDVLSHLLWVRDSLREDGLLVTDCFRPAPYSLSGRYVGYKAHYYEPEVYAAFMDYCGFDGVKAVVRPGRDRLNHVLFCSPRPRSA